MSNSKICIYCGSVNGSIKHGFTAQGLQRFKCKDCKKTFIFNQSPTKDLLLSDYKMKLFIGYLIDDVTLEVIARNLDINIKTAHYYRYIVFHALSTYQDKVIIDGTILLDETFIPIREKIHKIDSKDGKNMRGLSRNQLCVITLINLRGISVAKVSSRAMALPNHYIDLLTQNIGKVDRFIFDGNTHTKQFLDQYECEKTNIKTDDSKDYNLKFIDSFHSSLKRYLFKHSGYKLKNLQHYLNFFVYRYNYLSMSKPENMKKAKSVKNRMIERLFKLIKRKQKVVNYRTFLADKGIEDIL